MSGLISHGISLLIVTAVSLIVLLIAYRPKSEIATCLITLGIGAGLSWLSLIAEYWFFQIVPIALAATSLLCSLRRVATNTARRRIMAAAFAVNLGLVTWWGNILRELNRHLAEHPVASLIDRLDYEQDVRGIAHFEPVRYRWSNSRTDDRIAELPIAENVDQARIAQLESELYTKAKNTKAIWGHSVLQSLLQAHRNTELQFMLATDFGFQRMPEYPYTEWNFALPSPPNLQLVPRQPSSILITESEVTSPDGVDYQPWHQQTLLNFINPSTLGAVEWSHEYKRPNLSRVVGFQPHAFGSRPEPPATSSDSRTPWRIDALSLVSLLKHRPAAVYVSENLPNMSEVAGVPTRPLDEFESGVVGELCGGEELIVRGNSASIRMVGSIRAASQCLECHQVRRGTLLGAFSYRLSRLDNERSVRDNSAAPLIEER